MSNYLIDDNKNLIQCSGIVKKQISYAVQAKRDSSDDTKLSFSGSFNDLSPFLSLLNDKTILVTIGGSLFGTDSSFKSFPVSLNHNNAIILMIFNAMYGINLGVYGVINFVAGFKTLGGAINVDTRLYSNSFSSGAEGTKLIEFTVYQMV